LIAVPRYRRYEIDLMFGIVARAHQAVKGAIFERGTKRGPKSLKALGRAGKMAVKAISSQRRNAFIFASGL
jgi:hypothetical protein